MVLIDPMDPITVEPGIPTTTVTPVTVRTPSARVILMITGTLAATAIPTATGVRITAVARGVPGGYYAGLNRLSSNHKTAEASSAVLIPPRY